MAPPRDQGESDRQHRNTEWALGLFSETFRGVLYLDGRGQVAFAGPDLQALQTLLGQTVLGKTLDKLFPGTDLTGAPGRWVVISGGLERLAVLACVGVPDEAGWVLICSLAATDKVFEELQELRDMNRELQAIMAASYDVIYVCDGQGNTLWVSNAAERLFGLRESELVGKNVRDLERQGVFRPSATMRVLETGRSVTVIQDTLAGRRLLVHSTPIWDEQGRLVRIVNTSRDITEVNQLRLQLEETRQRAARYLAELEELRRCGNSDETAADGPVVRSPKMKEVITLAQRVAQVDSTVLLLGESGVGKEVIARLIHRNSPRRERRLVTVNCGAIPPDLLESEFFGYERGAFTGANREGKPGLFELASGGTLFLDEVAELPLSLQVKLLRVLQEREVTRVGGRQPTPVDVRILAATNRNLQELVRAGQFRADLYYRLNVVPIHIPPLRERREEIPALIHHFLERFNARYGRHVQVTSAALKAMESYDWPGNVRELENVVERLVVVGNSQLIDVVDLPEAVRSRQEFRDGLVHVRELVPLRQAIEEVERQLLLEAYERYGNTYRVAEALGINQSTVVRKLKKCRENARPHSQRMRGGIQARKRS